jgi:hypothetical protein
MGPWDLCLLRRLPGQCAYLGRGLRARPKTCGAPWPLRGSRSRRCASFECCQANACRGRAGRIAPPGISTGPYQFQDVLLVRAGGQGARSTPPWPRALSPGRARGGRVSTSARWSRRTRATARAPPGKEHRPRGAASSPHRVGTPRRDLPPTSTAPGSRLRGSRGRPGTCRGACPRPSPDSSARNGPACAAAEHRGPRQASGAASTPLESPCDGRRTADSRPRVRPRSRGTG